MKNSVLLIVNAHHEREHRTAHWTLELACLVQLVGARNAQTRVAARHADGDLGTVHADNIEKYNKM